MCSWQFLAPGDLRMMRARTEEGRPLCLSMWSCGLVWEVNSSQAVDLWSFHKVLGLTGPPQSLLFIVQPGVWGPLGPSRIMGRSEGCGEGGRGQGEPGQAEQSWGPAGCQAASLLLEMVFVLWHPPVSIVVSHNSMACFSSLAIRVASHHRHKRSLWMTFFLHKRSLPFYSGCLVSLACPDMSFLFMWPFSVSIALNG